MAASERFKVAKRQRVRAAHIDGDVGGQAAGKYLSVIVQRAPVQTFNTRNATKYPDVSNAKVLAVPHRFSRGRQILRKRQADAVKLARGKRVGVGG